MHYIAISIHDIGIFGIGCYDERTEFTATYIGKVSIIV